MKTQFWALPPEGARMARSRTLVIKSSGTGSGFSRRRARAVYIASNRSIAAIAGLLQFELILVGRPASHFFGREYLRQLVDDRSIALDRHNGQERKDTGWPLTPRYWWWAQVQRACSWQLS